MTTASVASSSLDCFLVDKDALLQAFEACDSLKFSDFARCWRDMSFSLVLYGRRAKELKAWLTACHSVLIPDLLRHHPVNRRVFAMYMLYALFFKSPMNADRVPVRLTSPSSAAVW